VFFIFADLVKLTPNWMFRVKLLLLMGYQSSILCLCFLSPLINLKKSVSKLNGIWHWHSLFTQYILFNKSDNRQYQNLLYASFGHRVMV
jgi:hypothetical protein